jgi:hypothetical protein
VPLVVSHRKIPNGSERIGSRGGVRFQVPLEPIELRFERIELRFGAEIDLADLRLADRAMIPRPEDQSLISRRRIVGIPLLHQVKAIDRLA